jgi:hypothetical protein
MSSMVMAALVLTLGAALTLPAAAATAAEGGTRLTLAEQRQKPDDKAGKGKGNSDAAQSCAQGKYQNRFDVLTGSGFTTTGACVAHAAAGGSQATLQLSRAIYPCEANSNLNCWGLVTASELQLGSVVSIVGPGGVWPVTIVDQSGTLIAEAQIPCGYPLGTLFHAQAYTTGDMKISSIGTASPSC